MVERDAPGRQSEARKKTRPEVDNLLTQTVDAQLLPPERFEQGKKGEIIDVLVGDDSVAILKDVEGHNEVLLVGFQGEKVDIVLDPSSHQIAENTYKVYVATKGGTESPWCESVAKIIKKLGYSVDLAKRYEDRWFSSGVSEIGINAGNDVEVDKILKAKRVFINVGPWGGELKNHRSGEQYFVFTQGNDQYAISAAPPFSNRGFITSEKLEALQDVQQLSFQTPGGKFTIQERASIINIADESGRVVSSYSGEKPVINPFNPQALYYLDDGKIFELDLSESVVRKARPAQQTQVKEKDLREFHLDPNGNYFVVRTGEQKIAIIERESGETVRTFDGAKGPTLLDQQGDILFIDTKNQLREIQTNFQAIPPGGSEVAEKRREEGLKRMQEKFAQLELRKVDKTKRAKISKKDVAETLRQSIAKQIGEEIETATDPDAIEDILDRLQALKEDPTNQAYTEVVDEFVGQVREKLSSIRTAELESQLNAFEKTLGGVESVGDTIGLGEQFAEILEFRQGIDITDPQVRRETAQRIRSLQTQKDTLTTKYQHELITVVKETLPQIQKLIEECGSVQELALLGSSTLVQQLEMMVMNVRNPEVRRELRGQYSQMRAEQRNRLEVTQRRIEAENRQRWAQVVDEAREDLEALKEQIAELSEAKEVDRFGRHPLVTAWRSKLFALPPELREIEEKRLEIILGAKKKDIDRREQLGAIGEAKELRFGEVTFPVFEEPPRIWQPKLLPREGGFSNWADLVFEDSQGRVWKPHPEHEVVVVADMEDEKTKETIERYRPQAAEYFEGLSRKVPDFDEHWRIAPYHMEKIEEVAETLNLQLIHHRGILILHGEAGTGKNVLAEMLANLSNREVITIACNENTVKEDLMYEFYYDPETGTYKLPSQLVEGIQTPGVIVLFDEINALKSGVAKLTNPLFDYRRRIFLTEGGKRREIIADPTVLFIGTMNPQNYAGVQPLSPEVKSRSRVVDIDYPPFEEMRGGRTHYRSDEAEILAAYMNNLSELRQEELRLCWDYVVNHDTSNGADRILIGDQTIEQDLRRIYDVIRVSNRLRRMYEAYQIGDSNEPMDFPVSLREATDIVMEMNHRQGVKEIIKRVIVPKIDDRRQKRMVEQTIDAILP